MLFKSILFILANFKWKEIRTPKNLIVLIKNISLRLPVITDIYTKKNVLFLWESTVSGNFIYPYLFKSTGNPTIALPHNLESLVPTQKDDLTGKTSPDWFLDEVKRLALCDAVFTISREECWLLKLHGLNAFYLPYYPPREAEALFLAIREKRMNSKKENSPKQYLLIGSTNNPPTFQGMKQIIELFHQLTDDSFLIVGGYNSESLKPYIHSPEKIQLHGTLSNEQLTELLISTDAVIINQQATTGALTRIPEMLIAGIPVIVNADAARSFYDANGVVLFNNLIELPELIIKFEPFLPLLYTKSEKFTNEFINLISNI